MKIKIQLQIQDCAADQQELGPWINICNTNTNSWWMKVCEYMFPCDLNLWQTVYDVGAGGVVVGRGAWESHLRWKRSWKIFSRILEIAINTWISMSGSSMIQLSTTSSFTTWWNGLIITIWPSRSLSSFPVSSLSLPSSYLMRSGLFRKYMVTLEVPYCIVILIVILIFTIINIIIIPDVVRTLQKIDGHPRGVVLPQQSSPGFAFLRLWQTVVDHNPPEKKWKNNLRANSTHWCCHTSESQCIAVLLQSPDPWNIKVMIAKQTHCKTIKHLGF